MMWVSNYYYMYNLAGIVFLLLDGPTGMWSRNPHLPHVLYKPERKVHRAFFLFIAEMPCYREGMFLSVTDDFINCNVSWESHIGISHPRNLAAFAAWVLPY